MTYLVDANVLSEPTKRAPNPSVVEWLRKNESELVVDPIILGELRIGVFGLAEGKRRTQLAEWFESLEQRIECLPWDIAVGSHWARLVIQLRQSGRTMPLLDGMIAATALAHGFTVATRNRRDFEPAGVDLVDPFA
jgi:toxin FitB